MKSNEPANVGFKKRYCPLLQEAPSFLSVAARTRRNDCEQNPVTAGSDVLQDLNGEHERVQGQHIPALWE